ncbi:hypothetical protein QUF63_09970 [Anaerolineales bacterium HSG25]|nr:hypothetical protein [Anaerolineales bacterium HSG25]
MNLKSIIKAIGLTSLFWLMLWIAGAVFGQGLITNVASSQISSTATQPVYQMNYQGYLTDGQNQPLDGLYNLEFWLYDAETGGVPLWGPETHLEVSLQNGLFSVVLGELLRLPPQAFKQTAFLRVTVDGVPLASQQVRGVPYSFSLLPGATVEGIPVGTVYGLTVINTNSGDQSQGRGIWAQGYQYGLVAQETGPGDVALLSTSFVEAEGYKSHAPSYLWVPGTRIIQGDPGLLEIETTASGTVILSRNSLGTETFYLPVDIVSQLYGQEVAVSEVSVQYYVNHADTYIFRTRLEKMIGTNESESILDSQDRLDRTTDTSHAFITTGNYTLTATSGPLNLAVTANFSDPGKKLYLGGVRLRLEHHD